MYVKPDALRYAAGLLEKEWGSYGYSIERVEGNGNTAVVFVTCFDGSRFVIAADGLTGYWGHAQGETDQAMGEALDMIHRCFYVTDGRYEWRDCAFCASGELSVHNFEPVTA